MKFWNYFLIWSISAIIVFISIFNYERGNIYGITQVIGLVSTWICCYCMGKIVAKEEASIIIWGKKIVAK